VSAKNNQDDKDKAKREKDPSVVFSGRPAEAAPDETDPAGVGASRAAHEPGAGAFAEQMQKLLAEKQELMDTLVRRQADFENYRKRVEKERHQENRRVAEVLIERLLPVLDAFETALAGTSDAAHPEYRRGFELIHRQLSDVLAKQGLTRIESVGKEFNPHFHHAIERVETTEHADGIVVGELQPGYMFHDRVLRPAMVRVASAPESKSAHVSKHTN
jgi:molecular chaperone GrpE